MTGEADQSPYTSEFGPQAKIPHMPFKSGISLGGCSWRFERCLLQFCIIQHLSLTQITTHSQFLILKLLTMASSKPWNDSKWKRLKPRKRHSLHQSTEDVGNQNSNTYRRPLTPPLPVNDEKGSQTSSRRPWRSSHSARRDQQTFHQAQSPLLSNLPAEVRLIIWWYFLCSQKLHIVLTNQHTWKQSESKIIGLACSERRGYCPCSHHCWGQLARRPAGGCIEVIENGDSPWHEQHGPKFDAGRVSFVPLLQTCRMM